MERNDTNYTGVANHISVYINDVVKSKKYEGLFGIITEVVDSSTSSSEEKMRDDDNDDIKNVQVYWINGSRTIEYARDITVIDRRFSYGDFVTSINSSHRLGLVMDVNISVDLLSMDGKVIRNVCSKDLKPIKEFVINDFIVLGYAFGRVKETSDMVTILSDDGFICEILDPNPLLLKPMLKYKANCPYYPGQRIKSAFPSVLKSVKWISGSSKKKRLQGTVIKVNADSMNIYWINRLDLNRKVEPPLLWQDPKNLTLLTFFRRTTWELGDFCLLVAAGEGTVTDTNDAKSIDMSEKSSDGSAEYNKTLPKILSKIEMKELRKSLEQQDKFEKTFFILNTYTKIDVIWQNGTKEYGLPSTSLIHAIFHEDYEIFPEKYVTERTFDDDDGEDAAVGTVVHVNYEDKTSCVRWRNDSQQFDREEVIGVYDLHLLPEYRYCYGDFVVRRPTATADEQKVLYELGNVIGFQDGDVVIAWTDGMISKVGPQEIVGLVLERENGESDKTSDSNEEETDSSNHEESNETSQEGEIAKFKQFDIIEENAVDHHYYRVAETSSSGKEWATRIQQEWKILEKNLPDDIYVRAFEQRMDLIRVAIIGADGTPYQNGLFFFDFHIPPDYPEVPPSVHYLSFGLRINPNLYDDGKICLSLLNTWTGEGNETWVPSSSNILQVLVSLQGLVLTKKPYFNEAGYDNQIGTVQGEKNAILYNEMAHLLNLKTMLHVLRKPPMHFKRFVKDHFHRRGGEIRKACEEAEHFYSAGFKLSLDKFLPRLVSAFEEL